MTHRRIHKAPAPIDLEFTAVSSKSDTHRALIAAALAGGQSRIIGPLDAADTRRTREGLSALGISIDDGEREWIVHGRSGYVPGGGTIDCGASGTSCRLLVALAALGEAPTRVDGDPRLRERPLQPLLAALAALGARVEQDPSTGGLPVTIGGRSLAQDAVSVPGHPSSQFASALLMIGPSRSQGLRVEVIPPVVSRPYVDLTLRTMRAFGARVGVSSRGSVYDVASAPYRSTPYTVEGDWSAASYWLALPALVGGRVVVSGLRADSSQPDARFVTFLAEAGLVVHSYDNAVEIVGGPGIRAFDVDATDCPDLVPTLAAVALAADGPCRIRGVGHLRYKESDRLRQLEHNLKRFGVAVRVERDAFEIDGRSWCATESVIQTRADHRIAMAFAIVGLRAGGVVIDDAACVAKSNPGFWSDFACVERAGVARQN